MKNLLLKLKESAISVLPVSAVVFICGITLAGLSTDYIIKFVIGTVMLIVGLVLFSLGADVSILPIGNHIGANMAKSKRLYIIIPLCFLIGVIVTIAEPDLMVLAEQLSGAISKVILIAFVALGVGIFFVIAILRIIFQINIKTIFAVSYGIIFVLAITLSLTVGEGLLPAAFDSGGVTTGPMTVPFIMAIGIGIASAKKGNNVDDSFGLLGLCSVGPIMAVLILGFIFPNVSLNASSILESAGVSSGIFMDFLTAMPEYMGEVTIALIPILIFFLIFNALSLKLSVKTVIRLCAGLVYVYVGLIIFLTGVNVGFAPVGRLLGESIVAQGYERILIPIGMAIGFLIVLAEPAVHVLNEQIEEISGGAIKKRVIQIWLMLGVSAGIGLSMVRILYDISLIWFIVPGYLVAIILSFFVPNIFTSIAFDSGGVASGTMTAAFLLPFCVGISIAKGGNILTSAFGVIAMVAMMPLIAIQVLGLVTRIKKADATKKAAALPEAVSAPIADDEIIDLDDEIIDLDEEVIYLNDNTADIGGDEINPMEPIDNGAAPEKQAPPIEEETISE